MNKIFLVLGYGIPRDIFEDLEYRSYLNGIFNHVFEQAQEDKCHIIFSGGKTDMIAPYKRSEAEEMKRYFDYLCKRKFLKGATINWILLTDTKSLSTMENILNCSEIIKKKNLKCEEVEIFCEFTRISRIRKLAKIILASQCRIKLFPIDFSISENRYLSKDYISEKEKGAVRFDLWALRSEEKFKIYHKNFSDKFKFLRSYGPDRHQEAIRDWWEKEIGFLKKLK